MIAIVITERRPRVDRGAALEVKRPGQRCWMAKSYHASASAALAAFGALGWLERQHPEEWRVACHELDCDVPVTA